MDSAEAIFANGEIDFSASTDDRGSVVYLSIPTCKENEVMSTFENSTEDQKVPAEVVTVNTDQGIVIYFGLTLCNHIMHTPSMTYYSLQGSDQVTYTATKTSDLSLLDIAQPFARIWRSITATATHSSSYVTITMVHQPSQRTPGNCAPHFLVQCAIYSSVLRFSVAFLPLMLKIWIWVYSTLGLCRVCRYRLKQ